MTWLSFFVWIVYAYSLGAAAVLAHRYAPLVFPRWGRVIRYLPGLFVLAYYGLSWFFPHPAVKAMLYGTPSSVGADMRFNASVMALSLSLYILAQRAGRGK